jgi:predicted PurR-regulated permease PerM
MEKRKTFIYITILLILGYLSFLILKPYLITLFIAIILAYLFYPLYLKTDKIIKKEKISALLISIIIIMSIVLSLFILIPLITKETISIYNTFRYSFSDNVSFCDVEESLSCKTYNSIISFLSKDEFRNIITTIIQNSSRFIINISSSVIFGITNAILHIFIAIFVMYYFFYEGKKLFNYIKELLPISNERIEEMRNQFENMINGIIKGQIIISILQGFIASIAYFFVGINTFVLLGILTAIASILPVLGTAIIWVPASLYLILKGFIIGSNIMIYKGIALFIFGMLVISSIDNLLRPFLMRGKSKIHPIIILIGVLGGITVFGFFGFILGPIILSFSIIFFELYMRDKKNETESKKHGNLNRRNTSSSNK